MDFIDYFKAYFNLTTEPTFMMTGAKLQAFLTTHAADILANDAAFATQSSIQYQAYSGNLDNSAASSQKWVKPAAGLINPIIKIALVLYTNDGVTEDTFLRVSNDSIVSTAGYPGIVPPIPLD